MNVLLDTHFLLWILGSSPRLDEYQWIHEHVPLGVSPVSLLEMQFLHEVGRIQARNPDLSLAVASDPRFVVDEPPLMSLVERSLPITWTRDPFDRLLCAHSELRRVPLCSLDRTIRRHHRLVSPQLG